MERFFNTAGPISTDLNYYIDTRERWDFEEILTFIQRQRYFVLHAPRQTGKTSALLALMHQLNKGEQYEAVYANIETAQAARGKVEEGIKAVCVSIARRHEMYIKNQLLSDNWSRVFEEQGANSAVEGLLTFWASNTEKPVVLFLDEVDALVGDTLISLLCQLRSGYDSRPSNFPISIVLCGVRDVRDYRIHSSSTKEIITGGSAFNVKAESLRLENFSKAQIQQLYEQHTAATGQVFKEEIWDLAWFYTHGQPWLVNALAYEVTYNMKENRDRSRRITIESFQEAKERLILRRDTHLDQLVDKLKEQRVKNVIEPLLEGKEQVEFIREDDLQYVIDLGLVRRGTSKTYEISNAIYKEVIPRELTYTTQYTMRQDQAWYINEDGSLNMEKLLVAFQDFFQKNSEHWIQMSDYQEAGPQLLLQAFLQRIVNGGGRIEREYGFGRGRTDLFIEFFYPQEQPTAKQEIVLELKILYSNLEQTLQDGIQQTKSYMDKCGTDIGHLLIFDRRAGKTWEDKIWRKEADGIQIWGC
ncbi:MAG: AAA-like domain-containing protein [Bacteroidota bacterium]